MSTSAARLIGGRGYPRQALDWMASEHPRQPLATAAIAEKLGIWLNDVHSTMYNLVAAGYMDKIADPADARRTLYAITPTGVEHSKLLAQLPAVAPVKLGAVHRRHAPKVLESTKSPGGAQAPASDAKAPAAEPASTSAVAQSPASGTVVTLQQPNGKWVECDVTQRATEPREDQPHDEPDSADAANGPDGGASTHQTPDDADGATGSVQPEARQHARLAHKMGRPLYAISPTGEVRVLLPRLGMSVYLQPDVLHKLSAASALVRQAGGLE